MNDHLIRGMAELRTHRPGFDLENFDEVFKFRGQYRSTGAEKPDTVLDLTLWLIPAPWNRAEPPSGHAPVEYVEVVFEGIRNLLFRPGNGFPLRLGRLCVKSVSHLQHEEIYYDVSETAWDDEPELERSISLQCRDVFVASFGTISIFGTPIPSWTFDRASGYGP